MPKRFSASASTWRAWSLLRVGGALNDKRAVGVVAVDGVCLRDGSAKQPGHELRRDGADLGELQRRVPERAVVEGALDPLRRRSLLGQGARPADPGHHPPELLVELETLEVGLDRAGVAGGGGRETTRPSA